MAVRAMRAFGVERVIALYFACLKMIVFIPTVSFHIAVVPILTLLCVVFSCSFFLFFLHFFFFHLFLLADFVFCSTADVHIGESSCELVLLALQQI